MVSPATRAHTHWVGRRSLKIPTPAAISRTPTARIHMRLRASSRTPIMRFMRPGVRTCGMPSAKLKTPRLLAIGSRGPAPVLFA